MDTSKKTDLVLIGKTGNGKSSTGNSILRSKAFKSTGLTTSETRDAYFEVCPFEDRIIEVVDAPGTHDTDTDKTKAIQLVHNAIVKALIRNTEGFHAFLLVVKYGVRQTEEEQKAINILKGILGQSFLKNFGIVIMCGGDDFINDHEDTQLTFKEFCYKEKGSFKTLLEECNGRIILFNNRIKDEAVKYQQVKDLVTMVDQLPSKGERYTNEHFNAAEKERDRLYVTASVPMIEKETLVQHKIILDRIKLIQRESCEQKKIDLFKQLLPQIENLIHEIETKDKGTGALSSLLENVQGNRTTVNNLISFSEDCIRQTERFKAKEEKMVKEMSAEVGMIEEEFEKEMANFKMYQDEEVNRFISDLTNQEKIYRKLKQEEHETFHSVMVNAVVIMMETLACSTAGLIAGAVAGGVVAGPIGAVVGGFAGCIAGATGVATYELGKI